MENGLEGPGADQLREVVSWRIACELQRRLPASTVIRESHPGGGQYDCLTLSSIDDSAVVLPIDINRAGSLHVNFDTRVWPDWLLNYMQDPKRFVDEVGQSARFPASSPLPPSTQRTVVYRFLAELLAVGLGRLELWQVRSGLYDTSGYGGGVRQEWFEAVGLDPERLPAVGGDQAAAADYWFVLRGEHVLAGVSETGTLHRHGGQSFDLVAMYQTRRRIWSLITETVLDRLP